jgi:hypothetical protein
MNRRVGLPVFGLWSVAIAAALLAHNPAPFLSVFDTEFFFGMACAWVLRRWVVPAPLIVLTVGMCGFLATGLAEDTHLLALTSGGTHLLYALSASLIVLGLVEAERGTRLIVPDFLVALGGACDAIYLAYILVAGAIWRGLNVAGIAGYVPISIASPLLVASSAAAGMIVSAALEQPMLRVLRTR